MKSKKQIVIVTRICACESDQPLSHAQRKYHATKYISLDRGENFVELPDMPTFTDEAEKFLGGVEVGEYCWDSTNYQDCSINMNPKNPNAIYRVWNDTSDFAIDIKVPYDLNNVICSRI